MRKLLYILLLVFLFSCEEKIDYQISPANESLLVVDALITNEYIQHKVKLSKTVKELNAIPETVSGATVTIADGDSLFVFLEDSVEQGTYKSKAFSAVSNKYYFLTIEFEGKTYAAETYMIPVTPYPEVSLFQNNEGFYQIVDDFSSQEDAMWEFYIDWSNVDSNSTNQALLYYYTLHTVDVAQVFAPNIETIYFPSGTNITQKKYSLTPEYAEFIRTLLLETEWTGGYFDVTPANLSTNLSNGAIGFFAACTVIESKIIVK